MVLDPEQFHLSANLDNRTTLSPPSRMPIAVPPSLAKESKPAKQRFGLLTKRNPFAKQKTDDPAKPLTKSARRSEEHGPPPSQFTEKPSALQRHNTVPQHRPVPVEAEQVEALGSDYRAVPSAADINQHTASNTRSQPKRLALDRIDQLDESNLFGTLLHHDGPYEAIRTVVGSNSRMPLGLSDNGRLHQYHERTMKAVYMPPEVPPGVPLNLSPGQVLPRNFRRQASKPPRFRNNLVAPLPIEEEHEPVQETFLPPRHANFNEIPFHKASRKPKQRPDLENPLDGPPIDPAFAIGLAMLQFGTEDDEEPVTPNPDQKAPEKPEYMDLDVEYDPYAPEHLKPPPSASYEGTHEAAHANDLSIAQRREADLEQPLDFHLNQEPELSPSAETAVENASPRSQTPSSSPHLDLPKEKGGSEETLVQNEEAGSPPAEPQARPDPDKEAEMKRALIDKLVQEYVASSPPQHINFVDSNAAGLTGALPLVQSSVETRPPLPPQNEVPSIISPIPAFSARRYDKQLPPQPPDTPPLPSPEPKLVPVERREWRNSALRKALERSATTRSNASHQSQFSTRVDDGHSPAGNMSVTASSSVAPQMMSQEHNLSSAPSSLKTRRDPIANTDTSIRYPPPQPSSSSASASQDRKLHSNSAPRSIQRRNSATSVSSSKRSIPLSPIQEDVPLPQSLSQASLGLPSERSATKPRQSSKSDPRTEQNLQRSQSASSAQARPPQPPIEVGQVYPQYLQQGGLSLQRSMTQLVPQSRPPPYTPDPLVPPQHQQHKVPSGAQMQQGYDSYPQSVSSGERPKSRSRSKRHPPQDVDVVPRSYPDDKRTLRAVNALSGVQEMDENLRYQPSKEEPHQQSRPKEPRTRQYVQEYPIRDNGTSKPQSFTSRATTSNDGMPRYKPLHVPKRLVMPAPLQQHNQPQFNFQDVFPPRPTPPKPHYPSQSSMGLPDMMSREPSPPIMLPPILGTQDAALSAGRKLKKRASHVPPPPPNRMEYSPSAALTFQPTMNRTMYPSSTTKPSKPSNEKAPKKVLSKKRTNL
ncbi:hypothetical protein H1R20_g11466, partial [Candolleomyces eurysporus]